MTERSETYREMRALAAELLRAQREGDHIALNAAMLRAQGCVPDLLVSLCLLVNRTMARVMGTEEASSLIDLISRELPPPPTSEEQTADVWRDAAAMVEALSRDDLEAARNLATNTPNLPLLHGFVLHVLAVVLDTMPPEAVAGLVEGMRRSDPPI